MRGGKERAPEGAVIAPRLWTATTSPVISVPSNLKWHQRVEAGLSRLTYIALWTQDSSTRNRCNQRQHVHPKLVKRGSIGCVRSLVGSRV